MTRFSAIALTAMLTASAIAEPIDGSEIRLSDGDTVIAHGQSYRLVGFNTPETWRARCPEERALGLKAEKRLRELLDGGSLDLTEVRCSCPEGTRGTEACNFKRLCGVLKVKGVNVGETLIAEGLAERYICGEESCPRARDWCP